MLMRSDARLDDRQFLIFKYSIVFLFPERRWPRSRTVHSRAHTHTHTHTQRVAPMIFLQTDKKMAN
jgi:hypothetical protein